MKLRIGEKFRNDWMAKEEGSYEDSNKSPMHVYAVLLRLKNGKGNVDADELQILITSAKHHQDGWSEREDVLLMREAAKFVSTGLEPAALKSISRGTNEFYQLIYTAICQERILMLTCLLWLVIGFEPILS